MLADISQFEALQAQANARMGYTGVSSMQVFNVEFNEIPGARLGDPAQIKKWQEQIEYFEPELLFEANKYEEEEAELKIDVRQTQKHLVDLQEEQNDLIHRKREFALKDCSAYTLPKRRLEENGYSVESRLNDFIIRATED